MKPSRWMVALALVAAAGAAHAEPCGDAVTKAGISLAP